MMFARVVGDRHREVLMMFFLLIVPQRRGTNNGLHGRGMAAESCEQMKKKERPTSASDTNQAEQSGKYLFDFIRRQRGEVLINMEVAGKGKGRRNGGSIPRSSLPSLGIIC